MTPALKKKKIIATTSLAGCFGCHMSLLDIDLRLLDLVELVQFDRSPLTDIKTLSGRIDLGIIEGGVCNDENVHVLNSFRKNCDILVSLGECAIMGGLPALRNDIPLKECLEEAYLKVPTSEVGANLIPHHEDLPKILDRVYPCHEIVKIDYFIPGCAPSADAIWTAVTHLLFGNREALPPGLIRYD
jgi:coenzyme F420-reducing hydrogenase gamma subunit